VLTHRPVQQFSLTGRWSKSNLAARVRLRVPYSDSRADCALLSNVESRAYNFCPVFLNEMTLAYLVCCLSTGAAFRVHGPCYSIKDKDKEMGKDLPIKDKNKQEVAFFP
jgi:hypothetical protein